VRGGTDDELERVVERHQRELYLIQRTGGGVGVGIAGGAVGTCPCGGG
jgi:hypothetical protein